MAINFPSSPALDQTYSFGGSTWVWNGVGWAQQTALVDSLPAQTGNDGKYLTTDGSAASWATVAGGGGGSPGGANGQIQFNNAGAFGGAANVAYDGVKGCLSFTPSALPTPPTEGNEVYLESRNVIPTLSSVGRSNSFPISQYVATSPDWYGYTAQFYSNAIPVNNNTFGISTGGTGWYGSFSNLHVRHCWYKATAVNTPVGLFPNAYPFGYGNVKEKRSSYFSCLVTINPNSAYTFRFTAGYRDLGSTNLNYPNILPSGGASNQIGFSYAGSISPNLSFVVANTSVNTRIDLGNDFNVFGTFTDANPSIAPYFRLEYFQTNSGNIHYSATNMRTGVNVSGTYVWESSRESYTDDGMGGPYVAAIDSTSTLGSFRLVSMSYYQYIGAGSY